MGLPTSQALSQVPRPELTAIIDQLFEHNDKFTDFVIRKNFSHDERYNSYGEFIEAVRKELGQLADDYNKGASSDLTDLVRSIISAHPRLGVPKASSLSTSSAVEQRSLQSGGPELAKQLFKLNEEYETRFPGLRFVVFVNGQSRQKIMEIMRRRIARGDYNLEIREAFNAMCDIALSRIEKESSRL